ncbi:MAG: M48 family metallopeptidase [bacterium]
MSVASLHTASTNDDNEPYSRSSTAATPPPNPRASGSSNESTSINADAFRVDGEQAALYGGLAVLVVVLLFSTAISLGFVLIGIAIAAVYVWRQQAQLVGSAVKVSERQFPRIQAIANEVATRLDMHQPELYILQDPTLNAVAMGFIWGKSVLLHSATVEAMTEDELKQIIGHEFAHIKCGHTNLMVLTSSSRRIYVPLISDFLGLIFLFWNRKAEYTL